MNAVRSDAEWSDLVRSIPRWAYVLTVAVWIAIQLLMLRAFAQESNPPHLLLQIVFGLYIATVISPLVLLAGLVNADSKRRGMRSTLWTAVALFPPGVGAGLYFLFRRSKPVDCSRCGARVRPGGSYCSSCGQPVGVRCPDCHREVATADSFCLSCGRRL